MWTCWRHSGESGGPTYQQYPPFFYSELRNFAVLSCPRKSALGFRSPDPEDVMGKLARHWGTNIRLQQAPARTWRSSTLNNERYACWRLRDDTLFSVFASYLSFSLSIPTSSCFYNNKSDDRGKKKKIIEWRILLKLRSCSVFHISPVTNTKPWK